MKELIKKVEAWSIERGLNTADPNKQRLKLWEEFGELCAATVRDNREDAIDAIGDMLVVMIIYKQQLRYSSNALFYPKLDKLNFLSRLDDSTLLDYIGYSIADTRNYIYGIEQIVDNLTMLAYRLDINLEECLQSAYDVIKDRRGRMVNGVFVKESDLK